MKKAVTHAMRIQVDETQAMVKPNVAFIGISVFAALMGCHVLGLLFEMTKEGIENTFVDYFGLIFIIAWVALTYWMSVSSLVTGLRTVVVGEAGVCCKVLFFTRRYSWTDIKDFGISYDGQTRGEGNTYVLYFSTQVQKTKDTCRKKLKGKMIKTYVYESQYSDVMDKLFSFCRKFTNVEPFVAEDKFHFI